RVCRPERVAAVDREQQPLEGLLQPGVEPSDGTEIEKTEPPILEQQDVAGVGVGMEDAVQKDLPEQEVEQRTGKLLAVQPTVSDGRGSCVEGDAVQALHHQ